MAFSAVNKAPGVYIDEIQLPGPIAGVSTSIAAFVGPAEKGEVNKPKFLTSAPQFEREFGGYITDPPTYVTHAVNAFFANGGTSCYFVRVGTGRRSELKLKDTKNRDTLIVRASKEGTQGDTFKVTATETSALSATPAAADKIGLAEAGPGSTIGANKAKADAAADAAKFFPGDIVMVEEGGNSDRLAISRVSADTITFDKALTHSYTAAAEMRVADLVAGQRRIRLGTITGVEAGTYLEVSDGTSTEQVVVRSVESANKSVNLDRGLKNSYAVSTPVTVKSLEFTLVFHTPVQETFAGLSMDRRHSRYFETIVDSNSVVVELPDEPNPSAPPDNRPKALAQTNLTNGLDEVITNITSGHYQSAIDELERVDDVNILCAPDSVGRRDSQGAPDATFAQDIQVAMIGHCEKMQDRFTVLDPLPGVTPSNGIITQRNLLVSDRGFGALYYPWVRIRNPSGEGRILVPPSGHIAGVYARTDDERGVFKAPANVTVRGVVGLERYLSDAEQGPLNERGINVVRSFPGRGIRVWGARTIAPKDLTQWRYVNVRRLLLFIEESIQEGTVFAVFEPNEKGLWKKLERQVGDFLLRRWEEGALFGDTPEDAFRVRIDEELNPDSLRALGILTIEVIVVPTTPAEFVVFRVISDPTGSVLDEGG